MHKNIRTYFAGIASIIFLVGFGVNVLDAQTGTTDTTSTALSGATNTTTGSTDTTATTNTSGTASFTESADTTDSTTSSANTTTSSGTLYVDTIPPIIKLNGEAIAYLKVGALYGELGAVAYDNVDGNISGRIIRESNVNTAVPGAYRIVYLVRDRAGNTAKALRNVYVVAPSSVITQTAPPPALTEPVKTEPTIIKINTINTAPASSPANDSIEAQTDRLLEILRQGNIQRIEEEKRRIIRNATTSPKITPNTYSTSTPSIPGAVAERIEEEKELVRQKIEKVLERTQNIQNISDEVRMDSDRDGVSNYDEKYIYETDPESADTDDDGYSDRAEIATGFDPKDPSLQGIITYENPKDSGEVKKDILTVASIAVVESKEVKTENEKSVARKVEFKGRGLPNSFVTIYIFSIPTVITVKTDDEGNWEYVLDKELSDGNHEMYVAMTDNAGKILAKSTAVPFIKEANAITVDQNFLTPISGGKSPSLLWGEYMYAAVTVVLSIIGIIFAIIGMRAQPYYRRYKNDSGVDNNAGDGNNNV